MNACPGAKLQTLMSARNLRIVITRNARRELGDILLHSGRAWGRKQRSSYKSLIRRTLTTLASSPDIGQRRDDLSPGLRSHPLGSHVVYYWVVDGSLVVSHILHYRQDPELDDWTYVDER